MSSQTARLTFAWLPLGDSIVRVSLTSRLAYLRRSPAACGDGAELRADAKFQAEAAIQSLRPRPNKRDKRLIQTLAFAPEWDIHVGRYESSCSDANRLDLELGDGIAQPAVMKC